jgi:hypothetical protein
VNLRLSQRGIPVGAPARGYPAYDGGSSIPGVDMTGTHWKPDGALEENLLAARRRGDSEGFLRYLSQADLLLPLPPGVAGTGPMPWATTEISGRRWVLSFTSTAALHDTLGAEQEHRVARFTELASTWPDPSLELAVNPGLPIEAFLSTEAVVDVAAEASRPATELERALAAAVAEEDLEAYARALLEVEVVVPVDPTGTPARDLTDPAFPWLRLDGDGAIVVFTSERRLRDQLGTHPHFGVGFAALVQAWPEADTAAAIDPGTTFAGMLAGPVIGYLGGRVAEIERIAEDAVARVSSRSDLTEQEQIELAERLVRQRLGQEPVATLLVELPGTVVQVVVSAGQVDRYLVQRHRRVAGMIHRRPADTMPLAALYARLGLLGDGSPFGAADDAGYVLRWSEPDPGAYAVPTMDGVEVPDGAILVRIERDGGECQLGTYRAALAAWTPGSGPT